MDTKTCSKCGRVYPGTIEYFHKASRLKSGLTAQCKECRNSYNRVYKKDYLNNHRQEIYDYNNIHHWIQRRKPKPERCPMCDKYIKIEDFQLANLSGKYLKDERDFIYLCLECHLLLDNILKEAKQ